MKTKICFAAAVLALALAGCQPGASVPAPAAAAPNARSFMVTGVVERVVIPERHAIIRHEKIPGYMAAMTMRFDVKDTNELSGLQPGDALIFRYLVTEQEEWIEQVRKTGVIQTNASLPKVIPRFVEELTEGAPLPDWRFTNQHGLERRLADFRGRPVALTFIFTRCTLPHVCAHVAGQFAPLGQRVDTNTVLLAITLDPGHDTPEVLRAYMQARGWNTITTEFLTGDAGVLRDFARQCGVVRLESGGVIQHNLRLVLADASGRITRFVRGNTWTEETMARELAAMTERPAPP